MSPEGPTVGTFGNVLAGVSAGVTRVTARSGKLREAPEPSSLLRRFRSGDGLMARPNTEGGGTATSSSADLCLLRGGIQSCAEARRVAHSRRASDLRTRRAWDWKTPPFSRNAFFIFGRETKRPARRRSHCSRIPRSARSNAPDRTSRRTGSAPSTLRARNGVAP